MKSKIWMLIVLVFFLAGCSLIRQGIEDYNVGKSTILVEGEQSPQDTAQQLVDLIKVIPIVGNYSRFLLPVLVGFLTWKRGRRIREGRGIETSITGNLGTSIAIGKFNLEGLVKIATDTIHGAFEIGKDGSAVKRTWKVWLSLILAGISGALFIPGVKEFLSTNLKSVAIISFMAGLFGGLEKKIQSLER